MGGTVMKVLLTTLNSKFIHSNLAIRYLKAYCGNDYSMEIHEFTINDNIERVVGDIYLRSPDVVAFSCYIWNIRETLMIVDTLKRIMNRCIIVLGGPEVSFDPADIMGDNPSIDIIIVGEGEETFHEFLSVLKVGGDLSTVKGLAYRSGNEIIVNSPRPLISDLDTIPFPYSDGSSGLENKIIYYETSRGCPFNCQYCLSSTMAGVRYFSLSRVDKELEFFIRAGVPQVKLVDRTFNCHPDRAKHIFRTILSLEGKTNFHFEMAGNLIDQEMLDILRQAPPGLFQFEIGVQSTNPQTIELIQRKTDFSRLSKMVKQIGSYQNIHLHLDLIAGLPGEDYQSFKHSFNDIFDLSPNRIQLGFLKLLKGSGLRLDAQQYGYQFTTYPPYQVLKNRNISYSELLKLERIEDLVEKYYNAHGFQHTLSYLIQYHNNNAFEFFENFMVFWQNEGYLGLSYSKIRLYEILLEYGFEVKGVNRQLLRNIMRFDWVSQQKPARYPRGLQPRPYLGLRKAVDDFFKIEENIDKFLPHLKEYTSRQISRMAHIEMFEYDILTGIEKGEYLSVPSAILFDYNIPIKIFQKSRCYNVEL
jgi:radical SAM superfamily enzyme YgiQ (UPF0313 family)